MTTINDLMELERKFRAERGWGGEDLKDSALSLVLEAAEVLELFQWVTGKKVKTNAKLKRAVGEELADVLWWVLAMVDSMGLDLASTFKSKVKKQGLKYSLEEFGKGVSNAEKRRAYYRLKARTRGGHPLADEVGNDQ